MAVIESSPKSAHHRGASGRGARRPVRHRRGRIVASLGVLLALAISLHGLVPETGGLRLAWESSLPWAGILVALLAVCALIRRSTVAGAGVLIAAVTWTALFGAQILPARAASGPGLVVATNNVGAQLPQPTATADALIAADPDIVSVQEIAGKSGKIIRGRLNAQYPHHEVVATVGLWSRYPISDVRQLGLGMPWARSFSATVTTPSGPVRVYAAHLPSVRPGLESERDTALAELGTAIAHDSSRRIILAGDLNTAATDSNLAPLRTSLKDTRAESRGGFGFTWPSAFPVTRPDHIMVRGLSVLGDQVQKQSTSDHRAVVARLSF